MAMADSRPFTSAFAFPAVSDSASRNTQMEPSPMHPQLQPQPQARRATVPRTAQEWNARRGIITHLYRDCELPLKEVQRVMETEYLFKATKRMYNTRLNQWNIRKNYRAAEKELLAARITQAHLQNRPVADITFKGRPVKLHRVLRHIRDPKRGSGKAGARQSRSQRVQTSTTTRSSDDDESAVDSSASSSASDHARDDTMVRVHSRTPDASSATPVESGNTTSSALTPSSSEAEVEDDGDGEPFEMIERDELQLDLPALRPPVFPPRDSLNVDLILHQTRSYYLDVVGSAVAGPADNSHHVVDTTTLFWSNVKSGIYFLKKQSPTLAWPLLNDACVLVGDIFAQQQPPVLFLNSVFTVLSPINTRVYPQMRRTLLRYLARMAAIKLNSRQHPLAVICREMARDNELGEASEAASNLTLALFTQTLGSDHKATFAVHRSLISLLRRAKRLDAAKHQAETLVEATEQALTARSAGMDMDIYHRRPTAVVMTDLCAALTELVHVHMDLGRHAVARALCSSVIKNYQTIQGVHFPDERAAYAMEDMAELSVCLGDRADAVYWLRQALDASCMLRGEKDAATVHIRDKLRDLMKDNDEGSGMS
ncbi:uncharacterized protein Z520_08043 [Fonsecaea multimorphosa CBS 102226]|uniref:Clr5 domain-containing protein n=1 Tax=Fonsecaea multimorphosa CBS 102226 TaxID=1442371 RepID=A0A0D2H342_9EURO|nr:uncharacterized protein Z520_08043 [Fonsecaea multimorphosa CBS 102226]KIX96265.1 hypothetical protein Z520_08043 [Fonsecaea multimorphosa CBS 102226]OAL21928.1 hypothetical protein AYO22_07525 [Fonsecaea multimorphosa]